jgi:hypothetical protein
VLRSGFGFVLPSLLKMPLPCTPQWFSQVKSSTQKRFRQTRGNINLTHGGYVQFGASSQNGLPDKKPVKNSANVSLYA